MNFETLALGLVVLFIGGVAGYLTRDEGHDVISIGFWGVALALLLVSIGGIIANG